MFTKYTPALVLLTLFAVIVSTLLVLSKIYYWQVIDFFTLPFYEIPDLEHINSSFSLATMYSVTMQYLNIMYSVLMQYLDLVKSQVLNTFIDVFGYDINAPFLVVFAVIVILCVIYALAHNRNRAAYLPLLFCLISGVIFILVEPEVTVEQVGRTIYTTYNYTDAEINYLDLLRSEKYAELDKYLDIVEKNFTSRVIGEYQYADEYKIFEDATENDLVYFDRWLKQSVNGKIVLIARGNLYEQLGWDARGRKFSRETSEDEFTNMKFYFSKAVEDHTTALDFDKKSLLSYVSLLSMAAAYDFGTDKETLFNQGVNEFPSSYYLASMYMHKLQPKWGGSYRMIRSVAMRMRNKAVDNPMLISLGNAELTYRARELRHEKDDRQYIRLKKFAMFYGVTVPKVLDLTLYYDNKNDTKNALFILMQGLRFHPDDVELLANRAHYYVINDNIFSATTDIEKVTPDKINNAWICYIAAEVYDKLQQPEKSIPFYLRSIKLEPRSEYAYNRLYWLSYKKVMTYKEALPYIKKWTEMDPDSSDAWISYATTLKEIDPVSSIPAYKEFIKYANRESSIDMTAVRYVEKLIKSLESR